MSAKMLFFLSSQTCLISLCRGMRNNVCVQCISHVYVLHTHREEK